MGDVFLDGIISRENKGHIIRLFGTGENDSKILYSWSEANINKAKEIFRHFRQAVKTAKETNGEVISFLFFW